MQAAVEPGTLSASRNGFKDMGTSQIHSAAHVSGAVSSTPAEAGENRLFSRRAEDESLDRTDSKQAVACWSVSVGDSPPLLSHFPLRLKPGKNAILPEEPQAIRMAGWTA